jgi:hypothetical protein
MTTTAAIDRVVLHSVILDMIGMASYRAKQASDQHASANGVATAAATTDKVEPGR